ncbi:hypothetical protein MMC25_001231 [Agyrium rufum]|nr:hypothetical protein [Agyrium rufum]
MKVKSRKLGVVRRSTTFPSRNNEEPFGTSKQDKRRVKHSSFVSRIEKASTKTKKRRRPTKKLTATLEPLLDTLPDLDDQNIISNNSRSPHFQKSMKSRPGAIKRKSKLEKDEMQRFNQNLVQLADLRDKKVTGLVQSSEASAALMDAPGREATVPPTATVLSARWAAIKSHVAQSMNVDSKYPLP